MKTRVDQRFRVEAARFAFRFACDDCAHFDGETESVVSGGSSLPPGRCSLGFVAAPRRNALERDSLESCKTFELA
jgi:hypothetical protein